MNIFLPKFKLNFSSRMKTNFTEIGLGDVFGDIEIVQENIQFDDIIHKVSIMVDEKGTEASGGTSVMTSRSFIPTVNINKPFNFFYQKSINRRYGIYWKSNETGMVRLNMTL